jgi:hypothetical protein
VGIQRAQEDGWTKEMAKWEQRPVLVNGTFIQPIPMDQGGKANMPFQPFPKMLYKAESADGGPRISACKIVESEEAERLAIGQGWSDGQQAALDAVEARNKEFALLAAKRNYNDKWMSEGAKAESRAVEETSAVHLPVIPEAPIKKRGRPAKVQDVS